MEDFNAELGTYLERQHPENRAIWNSHCTAGTQTEGFLFGTRPSSYPDLEGPDR